MSSQTETQTQPQTVTAAVEARHLAQRVPTVDGTLDILDGVSLSIAEGESVAIVGASGSGKSTLLGLLAGLDVASEGDVWLLGKRLRELDEDSRALLRAQKIGFVFQSFQLLPALTALENVMLPLEIAGLGDARARAEKWLQQVGLAARLTHYPRQLSGGEQQRVAIARAFSTEPKILFADEPTGNLDRATGARIIDLLFNLNATQNTTLILVTHDEELARRCQRRVHLAAGRVLAGVATGSGAGAGA